MMRLNGWLGGGHVRRWQSYGTGARHVCNSQATVNQGCDSFSCVFA